MNKEKVAELQRNLQELGVFHLLRDEVEYNQSVARNHADLIVKRGDKIVKTSGWKGEREIEDKCEEDVESGIVSLDWNCRPRVGLKDCGKPLTHQVIWFVSRWYGQKQCTKAFCEKHAQEWAFHLKNPAFQYGDEDNSDYTPVSVVRL